jgi:RHS repeat-associated protein
MTSDSLSSYAYDAENRLTQVNPGASPTATYTYLGALRVQRQFGGTTVYVYAGSLPIAEYAAGAAANQPNREYVYSGGQLLATIDASTGLSYQFPDHLSTRVEADASGNVTRTFGHLPFGESWYETGTASKWKFTTYERDQESGLDYAQFRFDSSRLGRFMSMDPLAGTADNPQSLNRFAYVLNNPVNFVDPSGAECHDMLTGLIMPCEETDGGGGGGPGDASQGNPRNYGLCSLDGGYAGCGLVNSMSGSGSAVACPTSNCGFFGVAWTFAPNGNIMINLGHIDAFGASPDDPNSFLLVTDVRWLQLTPSNLALLLGYAGHSIGSSWGTSAREFFQHWGEGETGKTLCFVEFLNASVEAFDVAHDVSEKVEDVKNMATTASMAWVYYTGGASVPTSIAAGTPAVLDTVASIAELGSRAAPLLAEAYVGYKGISAEVRAIRAGTCDPTF